MAIHRMFDSVSALGKRLVFLAGNVTTGAAGAVGAIEGKGFAATAVGSDVGSIVHDATGEYTFTLPGSGTVDVLFATFSLEESTKDLKWQILSRDDSARTITLQIRTNGTEAVAPADADLTSGGVIHYMFIVKNSSVE